MLDRLEIKLQSNTGLNVSTVKPLSRKLTVEAGELADSLANINELSLLDVDRYNLQSLLMNNSEWVSGDKSSFESKRPLWNTIYKNKANFFEVDEKDFFLAVNPVLQLQQSVENDNDQRIFLNSCG